MEVIINSIIIWIESNPTLSIAVIFLIASFESLALVGVIFPGSAILAAIGILIGNGTLSMYHTLLAAAMGGIFGDTVSFLIGRYYQEDLHIKWPFRYFAKLLQQGREFFQNHGKKSVFIARFVGPVRPIIPLLAGAMKMQFKPFILTDICSGILWAPAYMLPGAFFAVAGQTFKFSVNEITYYSAIIISLSILAYWLYKIVIRKFLLCIDQKILGFWQKQRSISIRLHKFSLPLDNSKSATPELLLCSVASLLFFIFISYHALTNGLLSSWNTQVLLACQNINFGGFFNYLVAYTLLAEPFVMVGLYIVILTYFVASKKYEFAILWFINGAMAGGGAYILKLLFNLQRPPGIEMRSTSSFPSAHTTLIISLLGYTFFLCETKRYRKIYLTILSLIATSMMTSRILLSAHWLTDVIGGLFWGAGCLFLNAALLQGISLSSANKRKILLITTTTMIFLWVIAFLLYFDEAVNDYTVKIFGDIASASIPK